MSPGIIMSYLQIPISSIDWLDTFKDSKEALEAIQAIDLSFASYDFTREIIAALAKSMLSDSPTAEDRQETLDDLIKALQE